MFVLNLITAIAYSPLIIRQLVVTWEYTTYFNDKICGYMWPCQQMYSRFQPSYAASMYALIPLIYSFVGLSYLLYIWIQFDKKAMYQKIFEDDNQEANDDDEAPTGKLISRSFFLAWNWTIDSAAEQQ